jgi:hypothetical protein
MTVIEIALIVMSVFIVSILTMSYQEEKCNKQKNV